MSSLEDKPIKNTETFVPAKTPVPKKVEQASKPKDEISNQVIEATLLNWQKNDRVKYESIKNSYLSSLSTDKRKIILEISSKLSPQKIDDHLKSRIIKYMKDHPEKWSSHLNVKL